jgi:hypothetical protein
MAEAQEDEVRFFISYASSDYGIASALYEELRLLSQLEQQPKAGW